LSDADEKNKNLGKIKHTAAGKPEELTSEYTKSSIIKYEEFKNSQVKKEKSKAFS